MKRKLILPLFGLLLLCSCAEKGEYSDWRGPKRDGIYPETGLLKQWPYEGPALLWSYEELGFGHTAVAVSDHKVYLTGIKDSANSLGTLLWEKEYGKDFTINLIGTRSTPVVVDDLIYIESGAGAIYCLQTCYSPGNIVHQAWRSLDGI
jgi:outer membrane protein assembly factor BamB